MSTHATKIELLPPSSPFFQSPHHCSSVPSNKTPMPRKPKSTHTPKPPPTVTTPYPHFPHPTPSQCRSVRDALLSLHNFPPQFTPYRRTNPTPNQEPILDGLISTLLSQNTTDSNSTRAFRSLKTNFPTWDHVLAAKGGKLEDAIRCGGLANTKAKRIRSILKELKEKRGEFCLEYLRGLTVDQVKAELSKFKGIGPKTVACVLMFQLQQDDFPVDTHVFRITKAIGWVPMEADREKAYLHLNKRIPDDLKFDLNCLLVTHGKLCERCVKKRGNVQTRGPHASCPLEYVTAVELDRK